MQQRVRADASAQKRVAKKVPAGYTAGQIAMHWLIAAIVVYQLYFGEDMARGWHRLARGEALTDGQNLQMSLHIYFGFAVLAAVALRLVLRVRFGAPAAPADVPRPIQIAGRASHHVFYVLLFLAPITGIVSYYFVPAVGEIHQLAKPAFIVLIALHIAATAWHHVYMRDGILIRMLRPAPRLVPARSAGGLPPGGD